MSSAIRGSWDPFIIPASTTCAADEAARVAPTSAARDRLRGIEEPAPPLGQRPKLRHFLHMSSLVSVLVVMLHAGGQPTADEGPKWLLGAMAWFNGAISLLRMPLFFFIAGFLFMHTNPPESKISYGQFVWKKATRLLLPYLFLSTLAFPVKAFMAGHAIRPITFTWHDYFRSLIDPSINPIGFYWFLAALFVIFLVLPVFRVVLIRAELPGIVWVTAGTLVLRWYCSGLIPGLPNRMPILFALHPAAADLFYVWIGMIAWKYRQIWTTTLHPSLAALGMVLVTVYYLAFEQHPGFVRFFVVLLGFYSVYCLIDIYVKRGWSFLRPIDGKTYQIYLLAWFPQQFVVVVLYKMLHWNYWLCSLLMFSSGLLIPLVVRYMVEQHAPGMAFLLGFEVRRSKPILATSTFVQPRLAISSVP